MSDTIRIDIERLRKALIDATGSAVFVGSPWAIVDVAALESATPEELIREAQKRGYDLRRFSY